jgi:PAS domain S-box-containing protein
VSNTAILTQNNLNAPPRKSSVGQFLFFLGAVMLGGIIVGSFWFYLESSQNLERLTQTSNARAGAATRPALDAATARASLHEAQSWVRQLSTATAFGAAGIFVLTLIVALWSRHRTHRLFTRAQAAYEAASAENDALRNERDRLERELKQSTENLEKHVEERTNRLAASHAQLQKELNDRRQAERVMAQQAKELERSKDVLELHVQARTQELQKLQRRYEHILNSAGEGIYGLDLQGRTTFVNPAAAKLTGWSVEELIGKSEEEVFHKTGSNGSKTAFIARNGAPLADQIFFRKDGTSFQAECVRTPIMEKDRPVGAVVMFKDITERKRNEDTLARKAAELARSNAELEQFAYVASHDLQEPLRKIQAFGDRLKAKCDAADLKDGRDYLERMQSAAARMQTLINDLLTFSRVISTTEPLVPVDLAAITKEVLTDLEVRIEQTKAKVEVGPLPTIDADPLQMRQLLQNLVGNALKFQPPNSQPLIQIKATTIPSPFAGGEEPGAGDLCELTIQDNGIGFDEKYLDKIFAMFQRLHGRTEYEGTGVGLAVCRRIADRHGGTINARSKPGEGATFIVSLPVRQQANQLKAAA